MNGSNKNELKMRPNGRSFNHNFFNCVLLNNEQGLISSAATMCGARTSPTFPWETVMFT